MHRIPCHTAGRVQGPGPGQATFHEFISGGYYLASAARLPDAFSTLLPETLISISPCVAEVGPRCSWESDWGSRALKRARAEAAGECYVPQGQQETLSPIDSAIKQTALPGYVKLHGEPPQVMPFGFSSFVVASAYYEQFGLPMQLLGIVLHATLLSSLEVQLGEDVNRGYGLVERVGFHSWLCSCLPEVVSEVLSVRPATKRVDLRFRRGSQSRAACTDGGR